MGDKKKLFGVLNAVDIIVILIVLAAVVGVGAKTHLLRKMTAKTTVVPVQTQVYIEDILPSSAAVPQVGDAVNTLSGDELGVVTNAQIEDYLLQASDAQGNWHMSPVPGRDTLVLTLDGRLTDNNGAFRSGTTSVKVGSKVTISGNLYQFDGVFVQVKELPRS
jgi:3D (Asp-Asp-Asp) domain-containing protein